jgi:uncharacterized protein YecT (DUF1311 family)
MNHRLAIALSVLVPGFAFALSLPAPPASAASFNCANASSRIERMICADPQLSALDEAMGVLYKSALIHDRTGQIRSAQREWMVGRERANDAAELKENYEARLTDLFMDRGGEGLGRTFARDDHNADLRLIPLSGSWVLFEINATWVGNAATGNVNIGESAGVFQVSAGRGAWRTGSCVLTFKSASPAQWTVGNSEGCFNDSAQWGMNVSMGGVYRAGR